MPKQTLEQLCRNRQDIVDMYKEAGELWSEIFATIDTISTDDLSISLMSSQLKFEKIAEKRSEYRLLGQEIMCYYPFGYLYNDDSGHSNKNIRILKKISEAFKISFCSLEVKYFAEQAAELYNLDEYND